MSKESFRSQDVVVYDDVLPHGEFKELFRHLNGMEYTSVHARAWRKVWRLHDGDPLTAKAGWYYADENQDPSLAGQQFPTGSAIDHLVSWIAGHASEIQGVIGQAGVAWNRFSFAPWIYPRGSGLSLHQDGVLYTGAFTYFAHPVWRLHWGGHLLVLDRRTPLRGAHPEDMWPTFLDDEAETSRVFNPGFAMTVFPKPNRIVFLSPAAEHLLTRVDDNAGQCPRVSVAGFFHKPGSS